MRLPARPSNRDGGIRTVDDVRQTLSPRATALMLGVHTRTLHAWSETGVGPMPVRLGRYLRSEVELWAVEMWPSTNGDERSASMGCALHEHE